MDNCFSLNYYELIIDKLINVNDIKKQNKTLKTIKINFILKKN